MSCVSSCQDVPPCATLDFAKMILFLFSTSTIIQLQEI